MAPAQQLGSLGALTPCSPLTSGRLAPLTKFMPKGFVFSYFYVISQILFKLAADVGEVKLLEMVGP